jgi:hypothetical protein
MKYVSQGNGQDLDPKQVQLEVDKTKGKGRGSYAPPKPLTMETMDNVTCRKCGGKGHLASNARYQY